MTSLFLMLISTHDLAESFSQMVRSARYERLDDQALPLSVKSAIAFVIQLAIDVGGRDPIEMRQLEHDLLAKVGA